MSESVKPVRPAGATLALPNGESVANAVVQAHKEKKEKEAARATLAAAVEAGPPPADVPSPQPEYVRCQLSDGRMSYVPRSAHIYVESVGLVRIADILSAPGAKDINLAGMVSAGLPPAAPSAGSAPGSAYTTMGGNDIDLDLPFTPEFVDNALETAAEKVRDAALSGPEFTDTLVEKAEAAIVDKAEDEGVARRRTFLERRIDQEGRANSKLELAEKAVLEHPGIRQPVDAAVTVVRGGGRIVDHTKPKEVKVVCSIM